MQPPRRAGPAGAQLAAGCCPASGGEAVRGVLCAGSGVGSGASGIFGRLRWLGSRSGGGASGTMRRRSVSGRPGRPADRPRVR